MTLEKLKSTYELVWAGEATREFRSLNGQLSRVDARQLNSKQRCPLTRGRQAALHFVIRAALCYSRDMIVFQENPRKSHRTIQITYIFLITGAGAMPFRLKLFDNIPANFTLVINCTLGTCIIHAEKQIATKYGRNFPLLGEHRNTPTLHALGVVIYSEYRLFPS